MKSTLAMFTCVGALLTAISGCNSNPEIPVQQKAFVLSPAMSKTKVLQIMGQPVASEIKQGVEEWHYCTQRTSHHQQGRWYEYSLVAVYFVDGSLVSTRPYAKPVGRESCLSAVRGGNYSEPTEIREYRIKR